MRHGCASAGVCTRSCRMAAGGGRCKSHHRRTCLCEKKINMRGKTYILHTWEDSRCVSGPDVQQPDWHMTAPDCHSRARLVEALKRKRRCHYASTPVGATLESHSEDGNPYKTNLTSGSVLFEIAVQCVCSFPHGRVRDGSASSHCKPRYADSPLDGSIG